MNRHWLIALCCMLAVLCSMSAAAPAASTTSEELQQAERVYRQDGPEAALPEFERLARQFALESNADSEATAIRFIGEIHWRLGDFEQAQTYLQRALAMKTAGGDRLQQGKTLNVLGLLHWDLGDYAAALGYFEQAAQIAAELGDRRLQGAILNNMSLVNDEQGEYRLSLQQYQQVLDLYEGQDFARGEGDTLGNIGGVHLLLGQYREALGYYQRALAISEKIESATSMSQDHGNLGLCYLGLGDALTALQHFEQAIALARSAGMQQDEAFWLRGKANALMRQGDYRLGLENHRAAVDAYALLGASAELLEARHDLGALYLALGDPVSAETHFKQAIEVAREIGLARGITTNLMALGDLQMRRQALDEAEALYRQAWQRAHESGELSLAMDALLRLAATHREQKRFEEAGRESLEAIELSLQIGSQISTAAAHHGLAELKRAQGQHAEALDSYRTASAALPQASDPELVWRIRYGTGLALAATGATIQAIEQLQQAVRLIEGVRDRLEEQRFRAGYIQDKYQVYVDLVRLQMKAGQPEEAFSTAERLRARSYLDLIENDAGLPAAGAGQQVQAELKERIRTLRRAMSAENALPMAEQRQPAISIYTEELLAAEQEYEALLDDQRRSGFRHAGMAPTYEAVRRQLAGGEALIEYVVGEQDITVFVLTRDSLQAGNSSIDKDDLQSKVELLRDLIRRPGNERWQKPAQSLAAALIVPLQSSGWLNGINHLYLVPHGSLNYLPFASLPSGPAETTRAIIEDFTLAYLPTAAALLDDTKKRAQKSSLLVLAPARSRLQHAPAEARSVDALFRPESRLLLGDAATESAFKAAASKYSVLHLATHGYFNKLNPLLSGLELEADADNDGLLELHEILGLRLDAELVTLSACQTGLGSGHFAEIPAGDDFVGLTRAFLYAGSDAVMASLWEVDDASTAELMQQFYQHFRVPAGTSGKASALAAAQRALRSSKNYNHPYYWAPFVLMGTSRQPTNRDLGA